MVKLDSIITKVGGSLYALVPSEIKRLFKIDNGTRGEIEILENKIIITFNLEKIEGKKDEEKR